jgi:hypothetical protein
VIEYRNNWSGFIKDRVPDARVHAEVWMMHNWAASEKSRWLGEASRRGRSLLYGSRSGLEGSSRSRGRHVHR